ncbi:MAG: hypothetical protein MZW92_38815 [Comamonadaceae bacterium]|nr:hypothetical protein [Comamonadaceae bacterium]
MLVALINLYLFTGVRRPARGRDGAHLPRRLSDGAGDPGDLGAGRASAPRSSSGASAGASRRSGLQRATQIDGDARRARRADAGRTGGSSAAACCSWCSPLARRPGEACRTAQEIVFAGSLAIVAFLIVRLHASLEPERRATRWSAPRMVIFVFRAMPGPARASTWWMIDELGFDQQLPLGAVADRQRAHARRHVPVPPLHGRALDRLRRRLPDRSPASLLALPIVGMYYGLHEWTAAHDRRGGGRALHRARRHRARVAARPDRDDPDAGVDRQLGAGPPQGDLFRGDGLVHQSRAVRSASSAPSTSTRSSSVTREVQRRVQAARSRCRPTTAGSATCWLCRCMLGLALPFVGDRVREAHAVSECLKRFRVSGSAHVVSPTVSSEPGTASCRST